MQDSDCIFCKIIQKKAFAAILYEDEDIVAFMDIKPINEGHALIVPKKHAVLVEELDEELYLKLFPIARKIASRIKERIPETTAINYFIADGKDAGQEVFHVHLHVIPRRPDDGFRFIFDKEYYSRLLSEVDREKVKEKLLS
ncbi:MAG TPA: HIT domain-containing protein [Candidatus Bathyarchaeia archaeon]|nr:HIT domain-containing protein [Candidatus Bathyarchaeia archaeon]